MSKENIIFFSIKHLSRFYDVDIDQIDVEVEYRSFCLVYHQVYDATEPLKSNEARSFSS